MGQPTQTSPGRPSPQPAPLTATTPIRDVIGISMTQRDLLAKAGIERVADLLRLVPNRYEHRAAETPIGELVVDGPGTARGQITDCRWVPAFRRGGRGMKGRFEAMLSDGRDVLQLVWFNASYLRDKLMPGLTVLVQGKVVRYDSRLQMVNPKWQVLRGVGDNDPTGPSVTEPGSSDGQGSLEQVDESLEPIYPSSGRLSSRMIARHVERVLDRATADLDDPLPDDLRKHHAMPTLGDAYRMIHRPDDMDDVGSARRRLAYNELLLLQLGIAMKRAFVQQRLAASSLVVSDAVDEHIRKLLPFELTDAQDKAVKAITKDLGQSRPMNRLLQGDVGSGKTAVALYAMLAAVASRKQAALMAPTEMLAEQHHRSITNMLGQANVTVELLTASRFQGDTPGRQGLLERIANGQVDIVVGTHALVSDAVGFYDLAVAVVDEQHRFGVMQRASFRVSRSADANSAKPSAARAHDPMHKPIVPHHLLMTATPIPRTLSLTLFGDVDLVSIDQAPPGRSPIQTRVVTPDQSDAVYDYMAKRIADGQQAYVVLPAIESTEPIGNTVLRNVRDHTKILAKHFGDEVQVAAVHGQLKRNTREAVMDRFRRGEVQVLVATTVIEVGVDVPNATMMVIEHAERFGLAQLHQLRGRIGRGGGRTTPDVCVLIGEPTTEAAEKRLQTLAETNDGFRIAEMDLEIRGSGDFFGTRQSGLPPLRIARIPDDMELLQLARRDAAAMIDDDPTLAKDDHRLLRKVLMAQYGQSLGLIDVG